MSKKYILDADTAARKLERMAYEIVENNLDENLLILAGIEESGSVIARNIQQLLQKICAIPTEIISISLDKRNPKDIVITPMPDFNDKVVIIIDDVANSGKTMLYAMKPLLAFHPKKVQTLALVDRTHKTFPVNSDYVGLSIATTLQEHIFVETDAEKVTGAYLL